MKDKNNFDSQKTPCIIDRGVIFNKRDMTRLLQGLDQVEYTEYLNNKPLLTREGYVVEIFEDPQEATLFFNRRIHINVNSFEYIKINYNFELGESEEPAAKNKVAYNLELFMSDGRHIIVRPLTDPLDNPTSLAEEVEERRRALTTWEEVTADVEEE